MQRAAAAVQDRSAGIGLKAQEEEEKDSGGPADGAQRGRHFAASRCATRYFSIRHAQLRRRHCQQASSNDARRGMHVPSARPGWQGAADRLWTLLERYLWLCKSYRWCRGVHGMVWRASPIVRRARSDASNIGCILDASIKTVAVVLQRSCGLLHLYRSSWGK